MAFVAGLKRWASDAAARSSTGVALGSWVRRSKFPKLRPIMKPRSWVSVRAAWLVSGSVQAKAASRQVCAPVAS
jgi:hypothetical protein